jgi:hypothetical protein
MNYLLMSPPSVVRKRCTSTWSSSATSILASLPLLVSTLEKSSTILVSLLYTGHLIYKCGGIDKRTIEKFEKVRKLILFDLRFSSYREIAPRWGNSLASHNRKFCARTFLRGTTTISQLMPNITSHVQFFNVMILTIVSRKLPSWARVLSSMRGFLTS